MTNTFTYVFSVLILTICGCNGTYWNHFKKESSYKNYIECGTDPSLKNDEDRKCLGEFKVAPIMFYLVTPANFNSSHEDYYSALRNEYKENCKNWKKIKGCALRFTKTSLTLCAAKVGVSSIESAPFHLINHKVKLVLQDAYCADQDSQELIQFFKNGGFNCMANDFLRNNVQENKINPFEVFINCVRPFKLETYTELRIWTQIHAKKCVKKMLRNCPRSAIPHALTMFHSVVNSIKKID